MLALPRYGGSMEQMHGYLLARLKAATDVYFYERWKLETSGLLHREIYNVSFDSGFHFRQIGGRPARIEAGFEAYVCNDAALRQALEEHAAIVFPEDRLLYGMTIHCGIADAPFTEWRRPFSLTGNFYIKELGQEIEGVRRFDVDFTVDAPGQGEGGPHFACSVASPEGRSHVTDKGLNYRTASTAAAHEDAGNNGGGLCPAVLQMDMGEALHLANLRGGIYPSPGRHRFSVADYASGKGASACP